jgi:hypothetical protein
MSSREIWRQVINHPDDLLYFRQIVTKEVNERRSGPWLLSRADSQKLSQKWKGQLKLTLKAAEDLFIGEDASVTVQADQIPQED